MLYTRSIGDPTLSFFHARIGAYFQDDYRPKKGLTLSPGVRYSYQTRVDDLAAFEPRLGITWAPTKSGNTTLRASGGIFHGWLDPGIWWQTVRYDGDHQREVVISNPSYPDPGASGRRCRLRIPTGWATYKSEQEHPLQRRHRPAVLAARERQRAVQLLPSGSAAARQ